MQKSKSAAHGIEVIDTAVTFDLMFERHWLSLKGISIEWAICPIYNFHTNNMGG
jgi:hypothetical protein